jgi:hypothetical protein
LLSLDFRHWLTRGYHPIYLSTGLTMSFQCQHCNVTSQELKQCEACSNAWYCSPQCHTNDWPIHIVECNPGRLITTADRLGACVHRGCPPVDTETRRDFGFTQTPSTDDVQMRMKVYSFLILNLGVKPQTINEWREEGKLGSMMKQKFEAELSGRQRRRHKIYRWFYDRRSTFDSPIDNNDAEAFLEGSRRKAWNFLGGSDANLLNHSSLVATFHEAKNSCFILLTLLLAGMCPGPGDGSDRWVSFGFCGCPSEDEQLVLAAQYLTLLHRVSFDSFCKAYASSSLAQLFAANGLPITNRSVLDVLKGSPGSFKSVWWLKDFVCTDDNAAKNANPATPIDVDYGFVNCRNVDEVIALRNVYKQAFSKTEFDPLTLHAACLQGELFRYLSGFTPLEPPEKFRRLLLNPYYPMILLVSATSTITGTVF